MKQDLPDRTISFALRIIKLYQHLEKMRGAARTMGNQILRSGTSVGANIAEGQGAQSEADYLTKCSIALKEAHETLYWLELLSRSNLVASDLLQDLKRECNELVAILTTICKKLKAKRGRK